MFLNKGVTTHFWDTKILYYMKIMGCQIVFFCAMGPKIPNVVNHCDVDLSRISL